MVCEENEQVYKEREDISPGTVIISFLVGLGIGAIGSYLITHKKMREEKEREIADVTAYYDGLSQETRTIVVDTDEFNDHPRDDLPPEDKPHPIPKDTDISHALSAGFFPATMSQRSLQSQTMIRTGIWTIRRIQSSAPTEPAIWCHGTKRTK